MSIIIAKQLLATAKTLLAAPEQKELPFMKNMPRDKSRQASKYDQILNDDQASDEEKEAAEEAKSEQIASLVSYLNSQAESAEEYATENVDHASDYFLESGFSTEEALQQLKQQVHFTQGDERLGSDLKLAIELGMTPDDIDFMVNNNEEFLTELEPGSMHTLHENDFVIDSANVGEIEHQMNEEELEELAEGLSMKELEEAADSSNVSWHLKDRNNAGKLGTLIYISTDAHWSWVLKLDAFEEMLSEKLGDLDDASPDPEKFPEGRVAVFEAQEK